MKYLNLFATILAISISTTLLSQVTKDTVQPGNLLIINQDNIKDPWRGYIKSATQAYQQTFGSIFQNDTMLVRVIQLNKNQFGIAYHNEIQLNMAECEKLSANQFKSVVLYLLSITLQPKEASPANSFRFGKEDGQVVVATHGLRFLLKDGSECVLLQEAMAEVFGSAVDPQYVCVSTSRRYIGSLLNELVRKNWVSGLDLVVATQTNNPGLVIANIVGAKDGKVSVYDVRMIMGIFGKCYTNADWQSFLPELQFYRDNRESLYMLEP